VRVLRRALLGLSALVLATTACGIPSDDEPRAIADGAIDEQVAGPNDTTPSAPASNTATTERIIYLVAGSAPGERLVAASVPVELPNNAALLPRIVLDQLIRTRPSEVGLAGQATNQLPSDVTVLDAVLQSDGVLDLNLSSLGIVGESLKLAMAQIVFTATDLTSVNGVRVSIDGSPAAVPVELGSVDPGTVITKADYPTLNPDNPPSG